MALPAVDPASRIITALHGAELHLKQAFLNAVATARGSATLEVMASLLEAGQFEEALSLAVEAGSVKLAEGYAAVYTKTGIETSAFLANAVEVTIAFDQVNFRAVDVMRGERLRLITEFTSEQRLATRSALIDGIERGLNPIAQARNFRESIGLTFRQQKAVENYRRLLNQGSLEALDRKLRDARFDSSVRRAASGGKPLTQPQIDRMVTRYNDRYITHRSKVIGRTEALRAVHQGSDEAYRQAIDEGAIDKSQLVRTWVAAFDDRVRDSHLQLDGYEAGMDEAFPGRDGELMYPGDPAAPASETIACRCALSVRVEKADKKDGVSFL